MSLSIMTEQGNLEVPTRPGGGVNLDFINRVRSLEETVARLEREVQIKATKNNFGIVKLSDSASITKAEGIALPATEKNSALSGSIANEILKLQQSISSIAEFKTLEIPGKNVNLAVESGIYKINDYYANVPKNWCILIVFRIDDYILQIAGAVIENEFFFRLQHGGVWNQWKQININ